MITFATQLYRNNVSSKTREMKTKFRLTTDRKGINGVMMDSLFNHLSRRVGNSALLLSLLSSLLLGSVANAGNVATSSSIIVPENPPAYGQHQEFVEDMRVKVLGGYIRVTRSYDNDQWYINRRWAPIVEQSAEPSLIGTTFSESNTTTLGTSSGYTGPLGLERAGTRYIHIGNGIYQDVNNPKYTITRTETATGSTYRWQNRSGNWIDFDENHRAVQYGDRNNVTVTLTYDTEGRISGVVDHLGHQVLWYEYDTEGQLNAIRDYTDRRVEYGYTNGNLTQVTDVLGYIWAYGYEGVRLKTETDPEQHTTTLEYAANGTVSAIKHPDGSATTFRYEYDKTKRQFYQQVKAPSGSVKESWYDRVGDLIRRDINGETVTTIQKDGRTRNRKDSVGNTKVIELDEWKNTTKVTHPDGTYVTAIYGTQYNNLQQETDENGVTTRFLYDVNGNLTDKIEAYGTELETTTHYTYDPDGYGLVTSVKKLADANTAEAEILFEYDDYGNLTKKTDAEQNITQYLSHDVMGNVLLVKDARLHEWVSEYNDAGWLKRSTSPLLNIETVYSYDKVGNIRTITNPRNKVTTYEYDANDNLKKVIDAYGKIYQYQYDADNRKLGEINQEGHSASFTYDNVGRKVTLTNPNGDLTVMQYGGETARYNQASRIDYPTFSQLYSYNNRNRNTLVTALVDGEGIVNGYEYDPVGNLKARIDSNGKHTNYDYDKLNRQWKVTDAQNNVTTAVYDNRDNVISVTDAKQQQHQFVYYRNNNLKQVIRPMGESVTYHYDEVGNLKDKIDSKGQRTEYIFDEANRQTGAKLYTAADPANPVQSVIFGYDDNSNLTSWDDGTVSATLTYDDLDRKLSETINYGPFSLGYSYTYYDDGALKTFTGPDGITYQYTYDKNNQLTSVLIPGQGAITVNSYNWYAPTQITLPGGTTRTVQYNGLLKPVDIQVKDPAANLLSHLQYQYGKMQHVKEKTTETGKYVYSYDDVYRLTGSEDSVAENEVFEVDAVGNRTGNASGSLIWNYNQNDELESTPDTTYFYDDNGNLSQKVSPAGTWNYFYDVSNRLVRVEDGNNTLIAEYGYDPLDRRLWKEVGGVRTYYLYSDNGLIGEFDSAGNQLVAYGYSPENNWTTDPLFQKRGDNYYYYDNDHLGTPLKLTAANGAIVWSAHYSAFGAAALSSGNTIENNLRYPGQYFDAETGLHYNWRRYYDPTSGRYITTDPIGLSGAGNLYTYAEANPITYIDPTGELCVSVAGVAEGMALAKLEAELTGECFEYTKTDALMDAVCIGVIWKGAKLTVKGVGFLARKFGGKIINAVGKTAGKLKDGLKTLAKKLKCMNSFTGDTLVHTKNGLKPIKDIREGDVVLSFAEWSGEQSYQRVEGIITGEKDYLLIRIQLSNGETIEATDGHPFQVYGKGWRDAIKLEAGDRLYLEDKGLVRVTSLKQEKRHERVYNLTVANTHTYYVGREGVLVHNAKLCKASNKGKKPKKLSSDNHLPKEIQDAYEEIKLGRGTPNIDPDTGMQKIYEGREKSGKQWAGATEWLVPGDGGKHHRILQLGEKLGYVLNHNYNKIKTFPGPWYPEGGK